MEGWIKLHRKLSENPLWTSESFTRGQAWIDLILLANHEYGYFYLRDHKIEVQRGEVGWSQLKLSKRWKWSRSKVKKFLNDLEKEQQIIQQQSKSTSIIKIINYDKYQEKEQQDEQQKNNRKTTEKQQKSTNKNDKNDKNVKNKNKLDLTFAEFEKMRNKIKKPLTEKAKELILNKLDKMANDEESKIKILEQSIENSWQGVFPLKNNTNTNSKMVY